MGGLQGPPRLVGQLVIERRGGGEGVWVAAASQVKNVAFSNNSVTTNSYIMVNKLKKKKQIRKNTAPPIS